MKNYITHENFIRNTIDYLRYLLNEFGEQRLVIFGMALLITAPKRFEVSWKRLTRPYHSRNGKYTANAKAPNCPEQNPIEDIWLQVKTWVCSRSVSKRHFCALIPSFLYLKWMFEWFIRHTTFDFATLQMYGACSKLL